MTEGEALALVVGYFGHKPWSQTPEEMAEGLCCREITVTQEQADKIDTAFAVLMRVVYK